MSHGRPGDAELHVRDHTLGSVVLKDGTNICPPPPPLDAGTAWEEHVCVAHLDGTGSLVFWFQFPHQSNEGLGLELESSSFPL